MSTCEVTDMFFGIEAPCEQAAVVNVRRICVHEHIRDGLMCAFHAGHDPVAGICDACWKGPQQHECPVTVISAGEGVAV